MSSLTIKNDIKELNNIAKFIEDLSQRYSINKEKKFDINLCVDELVTNIIQYSYNDDDKHEIEIGIESANNELIATITDDGKEFNPLEHKVYDFNTDVSERPIGGLGIFLVRKKTEKLEYLRENNKNKLKLIFKLENNR